MEMVLKGEIIPIRRLLDCGFVNYLEDTPGQGRTCALRLARTIVDCAPLSVKAAKASVLAAIEFGCAKRLIEANKLLAEAYASRDAIGGPRAFVEKRKPIWLVPGIIAE
jgi:enoyl-CoA hydratase